MSESPVYAKTDTWTLGPYDDMSNAFVFLREPAGVLILDKVGWLAMELCTGYPSEVAADRFTEIAGRGMSADRAREVFDRTVAGLRTQGLIRMAEESACS